MQGLVDEVDVASSPVGTEIRLSRRLGRAPARAGPVSLPATTPIPESRGHVEVRQLIDDIDLNNATKLYREMLDGMSHDAIGLVVDLSEVRHIDSTGIRMLHQLAGWLAQHRQELRVVLPDDSSVRRVLSLSCFDAHLPLTSTVDSAVLEIRCARGEVSASDLMDE
jgi:anti-anti-sigma factor